MVHRTCRRIRVRALLGKDCAEDSFAAHTRKLQSCNASTLSSSPTLHALTWISVYRTPSRPICKRTKRQRKGLHA